MPEDCCRLVDRVPVLERIAGWIVNGGVREEWDAYVDQLERLGYERMIEIYQTAVDRFNG